MAEPDRTNADAERVSDIVARLRVTFSGSIKSVDPWIDQALADGKAAITIIEAQSKALAEARVVKPLEWVGEDHSRPGSRAKTIVGIYALWTVEDGRVFLQKPEDFKGVVVGTGVKATKAAAQADYAARILSALTPTPENPNG